MHNAFQDSVTEIAVPMFFIVSGFNYFREYNPIKGRQKWKNRVKSLLVPYLFWNCVYCAFNIVISFPPISNYFIGRTRFDITLYNVIISCIYHWKCNGQFWFVFNLLIFSIINPAVYYGIKKKVLGTFALCIAFVFIFALHFELPIQFIYRTDSIFYYYIGAFLGLHYSTLFMREQKKLVNSIVIGGGLVATSLFLLFTDNCLRAPIILLASYGLWNISSTWANGRIPFPKGGTTFLIYAAHGIIQPVLVKSMYLLLPKLDIFSIVNFVLSLAMTFIICVLIRSITRNYMPVVDVIITGWRR